MFQHRHYCKIASIIAQLGDEIVREVVARHFAEELRGTNQNYDPFRFRAAAMREPINWRDRVK